MLVLSFCPTICKEAFYGLPKLLKHIFVFFLNFFINQILSKWRVTTDIDRVACTRICGQKNSEAATEMGQKSTMGVKHWNSANTVEIEATGEQIGSGHCLVGNYFAIC